MVSSKENLYVVVLRRTKKKILKSFPFSECPSVCQDEETTKNGKNPTNKKCQNILLILNAYKLVKCS